MRDHEPPQSSIERVATGIRGVDLILGGGFLAGSVQLLLGSPGAGKTIFANQVAFCHASRGHTAAYVTLLAESHARMLSHLAGFAFFDPELVSRRILYMSGYGVLEQTGLDGLLDLLTRTIREQDASLLVIDGLSTAKEFAPTTTAFKRFLLRLTTSASLTSCTTLLVSPISCSSSAQPEDATVDGIVRMDKRACGARVARQMAVEKMRGTAYALGMHAVDIDHQGVHVFPRIESLQIRPTVPTLNERRLEFGIAGLDAMLGGGVLDGSTTSILGPTGTGKTLIGASFLAAGLARGERAIYAGLREPPEQVIKQAEGVGLHLAEPMARGMLDVLWFPAIEISVDAVAWRLLDRIEQVGTKRLVIDGIDGFQAMITCQKRLLRFLTALVTRLAALGATTVMTEASFAAPTHSETAARASPNNLLVLSEARGGRHVRRTIESIKVQAGPHDIAPRRIRISSKGLSIDRPWRGRFRGDKP